MDSVKNREHVAIVASNPSSYDAALSLKVQFEHRLKASQPAPLFDVEKCSLKDALEHKPHPSVVLLILGAPNSQHKKEVAQLVDTLRQHKAEPKPTLMLISSDHQQTMAALQDALEPQDQALAQQIKVFPDYINGITPLTNHLRECLNLEGEPSISFASSTVSGPTEVTGNRKLLMATAPATLRKLG